MQKEIKEERNAERNKGRKKERNKGRKKKQRKIGKICSGDERS